MKKYKDVVLSKKDWMTITLLQAASFKKQATKIKQSQALDKSK